jgi:hypothetical protein
MRLPDRRRVLGALAVVVLVALGVVLFRAPVPAVSGPSTTGLTGPESVPHSHVGMVAGSGAPVPVGGLSASAGGYSLVVVGDSPFAFRITGPDGKPVTRFAVVHDKPLHLIVVRHDLSGFQHVHPSMSADGTWRYPLALPGPGPYRAYADFTALDTRQAVVLGTDLGVGPSAAVPLPPPSTVDGVDGLTVSYAGSLAVGVAEPLLFRVTRGGTPVAVQPYLGAYGHLTMLRRNDLGYLHSHPEPGLVDGAAKFWVAAPSTGTFRMFLDFQVDGVVRTAAFTVEVS